MPTYTYRREDGTTFEIRQKFLDDPLEVDPETGQKVHRVPQASGIIFKGSGFYVTDTKSASSTSTTSSKSSEASGSDSSDTSSSDTSASSSDSSSTTKTETTPASSSTSTAAD